MTVVRNQKGKKKADDTHRRTEKVVREQPSKGWGKERKEVVETVTLEEEDITEEE